MGQRCCCLMRSWQHPKNFLSVRIRRTSAPAKSLPTVVALTTKNKAVIKLVVLSTVSVGRGSVPVFLYSNPQPLLAHAGNSHHSKQCSL